MAAPNRWAVREAAEATFYDLGTKLPRVTLKTLKMTEVQTTGETVYSQGGRGNAKLVGFSGNREATVTLQDAIFDNEALAMLTGKAVSVGTKTLQLVEDFVTTSAAQDVELKRTPKSGTVKVYPMVDGAMGTALVSPDVTGKDVTIPTAGKYRIYYDADVADAKTITVTASDFGGTFRLVCDVLIKDEDTSKIFYGQFIAPKAKIEDEFTFSFSPDGDPSVLDIPLQLLKDSNSDNMWELVIYGDEA